MTEDDARGWIADRFGSAATERVGIFLDRVITENAQQNLIAPSTIDTIWSRHALDSAQLAGMARNDARRWIDIGTGGGFPGMVVALVLDLDVILVEPRRKRSDFLQDCVDAFGIASRVAVRTSKIESVTDNADIISARAVAPIGNLLRAAAHCGTTTTQWLLPRGRFDAGEMHALRNHWHFMFHVEQSLTSAESSIVVLNEICRK